MSELTLRKPGFYETNAVEVVTGIRVGTVDREAREVVLDDHRTIAYDNLVLATGSIPTLPPIRGLVGLDGQLHPKVHAFRSLADCLRLQRRGARSARRAVVVGAGLLGLQVARALAIRGAQGRSCGGH